MKVIATQGLDTEELGIIDPHDKVIARIEAIAGNITKIRALVKQRVELNPFQWTFKEDYYQIYP